MLPQTRMMSLNRFLASKYLLRSMATTSNVVEMSAAQRKQAATAIIRSQSTDGKPLRIYENFRLRKVRKWIDFAPYVSKISFDLDFSFDGTASTQELWRQCKGDSVRKKYSNYTVSLTTNDDRVPATIKVTYVNNKSQTIQAQHLTILDIFDEMAEMIQPMLDAEDDKELAME